MKKQQIDGDAGSGTGHERTGGNRSVLEAASKFHHFWRLGHCMPGAKGSCGGEYMVVTALLNTNAFLSTAWRQMC